MAAQTQAQAQAGRTKAQAGRQAGRTIAGR